MAQKPRGNSGQRAGGGAPGRGRSNPGSGKTRSNPGSAGGASPVSSGPVGARTGGSKATGGQGSGRSVRTGSGGQGRQSVASARRAKPGSNRTQLIIGAVALVVMVALVVLGLVLNKKATAAPVTDHPISTESTSSVGDGVITVSNGNPKQTIDLFEDGLCPACQLFEQQYGQQINKAVDEGKLTVRFHFLNFLDARSASKDYSTRAAAAMQCVAQAGGTGTTTATSGSATSGAVSSGAVSSGAVSSGGAARSGGKGLFLAFHSAMYAADTQPKEGGSSDLSNAQLAALASKVGAPASAAACITSGSGIAQAKSAAQVATDTLIKANGNGGYGTPSGMKDGALLNINETSWLTNLLG